MQASSGQTMSIMWCGIEGALFARGLGGADLHLAVDGDGVAADDLAVELFGEASASEVLPLAVGPARTMSGASARHHRPPPARREDVVDAGAEDSEEQDCRCEPQGDRAPDDGVQSAGERLLTAVWSTLVDCLAYARTASRLTREWLVGEEVDAKFEVWAVEVWRATAGTGRRR